MEVHTSLGRYSFHGALPQAPQSGVAAFLYPLKPKAEWLQHWQFYHILKVLSIPF